MMLAASGEMVATAWETTETRSALMKRVRQSGTSAELRVRQTLTSIGARYRLNVRSLPGTPDVANRIRAKAIFFGNYIQL